MEGNNGVQKRRDWRRHKDKCGTTQNQSAVNRTTQQPGFFHMDCKDIAYFIPVPFKLIQPLKDAAVLLSFFFSSLHSESHNLLF